MTTQEMNELYNSIKIKQNDQIPKIQEHIGVLQEQLHENLSPAKFRELTHIHEINDNSHTLIGLLTKRLHFIITLTICALNIKNDPLAYTAKESISETIELLTKDRNDVVIAFKEIEDKMNLSLNVLIEKKSEWEKIHKTK